MIGDSYFQPVVFEMLQKCVSYGLKTEMGIQASKQKLNTTFLRTLECVLFRFIFSQPKIITQTFFTVIFQKKKQCNNKILSVSKKHYPSKH